jgi:putative ABC transport system substrate-binding protein
MRRRDFIVGASAAAAWPIAARGQQPERMRRIGILLAGTPTSFAPRANAFVQGLRDLGYVEGKTVVVGGPDVCLWHKADIPTRSINVRF